MATSFSAAAAAAVREARSHLGYREGPRSNENLFGEHYGWDFVAWCVQYAWYCGDVTGSGGGIPKTASTGAAMRWAKSVGRWRTTPQPGDWSIMTNSRGATIHTDLVESYRDGRLICIGGNTSGTYRGSVNEGNGVYRNDRTAKWKAGRILGFVRPFYGVTTDDVEAVQRAAGIRATGKIDPATVAGTRAVQRRLGLTDDGFPGPSTLAGLGVLDPAAPAPNAPAAATPAARAWASSPRVAALTDPEVREIQQQLVDLGYDLGAHGVDGTYGDATGAAVQSLQSTLALTPDGVWGPATQEALMAKLDDIQKQLTDQAATLKEIAGAVLNGKSGIRSDGTLVKLAKDQHKELLSIVAPGKAGVRTDGSLVEVIKTEARKG